MSTRSSARNLFPPLDNLELTIRRRSHADPTLLNYFEMAAEENGDLPVPNLRTIEELCQPSLNGWGVPISPIAIQETNLRLKNEMIQQSIKVNGVIDDALRGTFMKRHPEECYDLIENMTAHHNDWDNSAQRSESSSSITFSFDTEIAALKAEMAEIKKNLKRVLQLIKMNTASSSGSGTLPGNTITNPKEDLKGITTQSGTAYQGPTIPSTSFSLPSVVERETETESPILSFDLVVAPIIEPVASPVSALKPNQRPSTPYPSRFHDQKLRDKANDQREKKLPEKLGDPNKFLIPCDFLVMAECLALADLDVSINLMPLLVWNKLSFPDLSLMCMTLELADHLISRPAGVAEDVFVKVGTIHFPADFVVVDFDANPRVPLILERSFLKTKRALIDVFEGELTLRVGKEAITFNLGQTSRYSANYNDMKTNRIDVIDMAFRKELKICEAQTDKSSINEPPEVELKDLHPYLEYAFLEGDDKFPVIIMKNLSVEEKTALVTVLKSHKRAISWKVFDIKGIDPEFYTHKIIMEEDFELVVQHQRRVNPKIHDVIKNEVLKLLDAGLIYPISDSPWVSPIHCVPKKGGFTVVENEENELIPTRLVMGWRVCIDYRKLNEATRKDHFPLPFMDQMLERYAGNQYYCFLNGFSGYFQILIDPKDQEKTTFTCPYGTFAYRRMPFGLCNALGTFQRKCDLFDENNLFIFDDESVRISPIRKTPFRKKPHDSINVRSKSNSNKSLPRTVHRWLSKLQPLAEPVAKWFPRIVQICLWIIDSECSKHMTGNRALLTNFVEKFLGTVCFGNNDFAVIVGYADVGLEVAFRKSTCFVQNEDGVDFLTGDRSSNLYIIALNEVASNSSNCLLAKASSLQSWLWHQHLSHLNFATIDPALSTPFLTQLIQTASTNTVRAKIKQKGLKRSLICISGVAKSFPGSFPQRGLNKLVTSIDQTVLFFGSPSQPFILLKKCRVLFFLGAGSSGDGGGVYPVDFDGKK
nr:reverse transcriptase domain-containing protein, chloroplastic [Tanacetum cinerariifolium]